MDLVIDDSIPYGNVAGASVTGRRGAHVVRFAAHPHGGPESLWFCFRIARRPAAAGSRARMTLALKHAQNMLTGPQHQTYRPVARYAGGDWERLGAPRLVELADGRRELRWRLAEPARFVDIAWCYPYGRHELGLMWRDTGQQYAQDEIGLSQLGRPLVRLSNDYGQPDGERPGLYLVARQHSGETPGSWALDGALREFARMGRRAPLVWATPLANIDGIEQGDYGKDNFPYDLNRAWGRPPMRHETLVIQRDMQRWRQRCRPVLVMDFHAPSASEAQGCYLYLPRTSARERFYRATVALAHSLAQTLTTKYAAANFARIARYRSRWQTPNLVSFSRTDLNVLAATVEVPYGLAGPTVLTRERYQEIGRRLARAMARHA
jgi:hypothetical protein